MEAGKELAIAHRPRFGGAIISFGELANISVHRAAAQEAKNVSVDCRARPPKAIGRCRRRPAHRQKTRRDQAFGCLYATGPRVPLPGCVHTLSRGIVLGAKSLVE